VDSKQDVLAAFDARETALLEERALHIQKTNNIDERLAEIRLIRRNLSLLERPTGPPTQILAPLPGSATQFDWVLNLLRANREGLSVKQIIDYLEPIVPSNAKSPRKSLSSAIGYLINDQRRIVKNNGFCRLAGDLEG